MSTSQNRRFNTKNPQCQCTDRLTCKYCLGHKDPVKHNIEALTDPGEMTLEEWAKHIAELIVLYGPAAKLTLDAGYNNNISATLTYEEPRGILAPEKI